MPVIFIDSKPYEVKAGRNLLEVCLSHGIDLPYFCWHPALGSVGACRQCAVQLYRDENDTKGKLVMSCMEPVKDGLRVSVEDPRSRGFREQVIEWLMTNHPHDCPVCDEGGNCHLQDMTVMTGHDYRRYTFKKRTYRNQYLGPLIHHEMNRCIQCYRCVRYYRDYAGGDDLNVFAAHNHVYFGRDRDGVLQSPFSGNLAEVCPTGVFTDKTLKEHYTRKWDLTSAPSVCQHCSVGCNIIAGERYGELRCVTNRYNSEVNGYFLCDRGRFGYEFVNSENRIAQPIIRNRINEAATDIELQNHLGQVLGDHTLIGIGSPRASMETNFALMQLTGGDNFYQGVPEDQVFLERLVVDIVGTGIVHCASLREIEQSDAIVILGEDIYHTAPMMALAVRQSVMNTAAREAVQQVAIPHWNDAAVKELVQEKKGFLANCTPDTSLLDNIATYNYRGAPDDIARFGFMIASYLNPSLPPVSNADEAISLKAEMIASVLQLAQRPVIISGISTYNDAVIRASFDIAAALNNHNRRAGVCYIMPHCNSMGLAMMKAPSIDQAFARVQHSENITVIIAENDLYRDNNIANVDAFFGHCKNVIVLDSLHNATTQKATVLVPAATFAEADGTIVSYEGRAQRYYQVFNSPGVKVKESWKWLLDMQTLKAASSNGVEHQPEQVLQQLEMSLPQFTGISGSGLPPNLRIHGQMIPREPHRYSGRTAILANINVSEPGPPSDDDSPFSFTMEGYKGIPPGSAIPFYWAPGWNSVQSVNKYQEETGGRLRHANPGVKLFREQPGNTTTFFTDKPDAFSARQGKWLLLPAYDVYGSGELSIYTKALQQLSPKSFIALSAADMVQLNVAENETVEITMDDRKYTLPVKPKKDLSNGVALVFRAEGEMPGMGWGNWVKINTNKILQT